MRWVPDSILGEPPYFYLLISNEIGWMVKSVRVNEQKTKDILISDLIKQ